MVIEIKAPSPGESVTEVVIQSFRKKSGDYVNRDEMLAEIESDKVSLELISESAGVISWLIEEGTTVEVNTIIAKIDTEAAGVSAPASAPSTTNTPPVPASTPVANNPVTPQNTTYATGLPSPSAHKMMDEKGINPTQVEGTGKDGRILKADVINAANNAPATTSKTNESSNNVASTPLPASVPPNPKAREQRREKMSKLRQTLGHRLVSVKNETAMLTTFNEVDLGAIKDLRNKYKDIFKEAHGIGLGFMSFFSKACCVALQEFPAVNSYIDGDELIFHDYVDLGIAVSTDRGLMVPVIRNAESLSLAEVEKSISDLAGKARNNKISIQEMTGGTFTITNGGVFGSLMSTPILNPPQSGILGMHKIQDRPMVIDGKIEVRPMMYIALSYDHRVIDGRESVTFLVRVKELLEEPMRLLLNV